MRAELWGDETACTMVSGLTYHAAIITFAFAFELGFCFWESERTIVNLFSVFLLCFKGALVTSQSWWLCRGQIKNGASLRLGRIQLVVLILFSVSDIVAISSVELPRTALVFISVTAALLHLLAASMDRRLRMEAFHHLRSRAGVGWLSTGLDAAVVASSFLWASVAVAAETGERQLKLVLLVMLGVGAGVVVLGTALLARLLKDVARDCGLKSPTCGLPALNLDTIGPVP